MVQLTLRKLWNLLRRSVRRLLVMSVNLCERRLQNQNLPQKKKNSHKWLSSKKRPLKINSLSKLNQNSLNRNRNHNLLVRHYQFSYLDKNHPITFCYKCWEICSSSLRVTGINFVCTSEVLTKQYKSCIPLRQYV